MALLPRIASPRIQVPIATTACLIGLAQTMMHLLEIPDLSPMAALWGLVAVTPLAYLVSLALFVRSKSPTEAYVWAIFAPIVVAVIVGDGVIGFILEERPRALSIMGVLLTGTTAEKLAFISVAAAAVGTIGSLVLVVEVWAAAGARKTDPKRGSHHFTAAACVLAAGMNTLTLAVCDENRAAALVLLGLCAAQLVLQLLDHRALVRRAAPANGPYRTNVPMRT
jgi:hypothetical protein